MATGPLMPAGTTQLLASREIENVIPPCSIWQNMPSMLPLREGELNCNWVPVVTVPVLVMVKAGFAWMPTSQPEMKPPAIAKTSGGVKARSKGVGMAEPEFKMFSIV